MAASKLDQIRRLREARAGGAGGCRLGRHHLAWLEAHPHRDAEWLKARLADGFHVHHIDENAENNDIDNLLLVERQDHALLHAWVTRQVAKERPPAFNRLVYMRFYMRAYRKRLKAAAKKGGRR